MTNLIKSSQGEIISMLIDLKGTRAEINNLTSLEQKLNYFYEICEAMLSSLEMDLHAITFSDSCYVEFFECDDITCITKLAATLYKRLTESKLKPRIYIARGITAMRELGIGHNVECGRHRRIKVFHTFGVGTAMMKVFDAEDSSFPDGVFVEIDDSTLENTKLSEIHISKSGAKFRNIYVQT